MRKVWSNLSIANRLYIVVGTMGILIACELLTLRFAMHTLSAVRAFVGGEGNWSKAQKDAAISLERYALTHDEREFANFLERLKVPEGDHLARTELMKPNHDMDIVRQGFLQGKIHADDIDAIVDLLRRFYKVSYLARAIEVWSEADQRLGEFKKAGTKYHDLLRAGQRRTPEFTAAQSRVSVLNRELTEIEAEFSAVLGEGSRWMENVVISLLVMAVLTVEVIGLTMTIRTTRALSRGLAEVHGAARRIGQGDFSMSLPIRSKDELGALADAINSMGHLLETSYRELESRVMRRTFELETLAKENARLLKEATAAVKMRDDFFSIASHELKTPMTGLNLRLQLLGKQLLSGTRSTPEETAELVDSCLRQGRRLALLSDELLDLTRIRLGKLELRREACDLTAIVREVALSFGADAASKGIRFEVNAASPILGSFDPTRIGQVATNLISNAIKYGDSKPISVDVYQVGKSVMLQVRDHGRGISPEDQSRVFDRFERGVEKESKVTGLGLGLFISRQIVEAHGGKISVKSRLGEGSIFAVELPLEA